MDSEFKDCKTILTPAEYHQLRKVFGISTIPAVGIIDIDIESKDLYGESPPGLPRLWKVWLWNERKKMLDSGEVLPKIERNIIGILAKEEDKLFYFLRDLHIANVDQGIKGVHTKIEQELKSAGLKSLVATISSGKKQFFG